MSSERLYFRQLLAGRDFAADDVFAQQMRNFAYLIGDRETGDCVVVDPAYAAQDLVDALAEQQLLHDQAGLDGLAEADVVGDEEVRARQLERLHERTLRGGTRWAPSSVKNLLDRAKRSGLLEAA